MENIHTWLVRNAGIVVENSTTVPKINVEVTLALQEGSKIVLLILY
jgi:hypothetical protein